MKVKSVTGVKGATLTLPPPSARLSRDKTQGRWTTLFAGSKKNKFLALWVATVWLLTGCSSYGAQPSSITAESQSTSAAQEELMASKIDWRTVELPSFEPKCNAQLKLFERLNQEEYAEKFAAVEKAESWRSFYYEALYLEAGWSTEAAGWGKWDDQVRGIAVVKAREFLGTSEDMTIRGLETENRADFWSFVERVFQKILDDCDLQEEYLTRLEILSSGRLLVAEKKEAQISDEMRKQFAKSLAESAAGRDALREEFDWQWGGDCSTSFGYCKEVLVNVNKSCSTVFVEGNFRLGKTVVDSAIDSMRNLSAGSTGRFQLRTFENADTVQVTRISCY